jgi:hypothetical protein
MQTSADVTEIFSALSKAQGKFGEAQKTSENPGFKKDGKASKYADMAAVIEAIKIPMAEAGLAYIQPIYSVGDNDLMETVITHSSGQWIKSEPIALIIKDHSNIHAFKSSVTYYRRTCLLSMLGIPEADDDGIAAESVKTPDQQQKPVVKKDPPKESIAQVSKSAKHPSEAQIKRLFTLATNAAWSHDQVKQFIVVVFKTDSTKNLSVDQYNDLCSMLEKKQGFDQAMFDRQPEPPAGH